MAVSKGAETASIKPVLEKTVEVEGLQEFTRVYTDGSVMEDRIGCSDWRHKRPYSTLKLKPS
jgi:hypothetical protein